MQAGFGVSASVCFDLIVRSHAGLRSRMREMPEGHKASLLLTADQKTALMLAPLSACNLKCIALPRHAGVVHRAFKRFAASL